MAHELPPPTPGVAHVNESVDQGDWRTPSLLLQDAAVFYATARRYDESRAYGAIEATGRYVRASILAAFSALEAQLNLTAFNHAVAHQELLTPFVHDVLTEVETVLDEQGRIHKRPRRISMTARLSFLTAFLSGQPFPRGGQLWQDLLEAIALRDSCVHPKPPFPFDWEPDQARHVLTTVSAVLAEVSHLMGLEPPRWLRPADELVESLGDELR
ncbi:hypothetical protein [Modestobacter marinus]|uniref:hypothetical protein n=1 Tax=Modestobacter marinus TaxID=477641 RepID=UPI001C964A08|nr:hypothetical protein [Modestobacter marinus]